MEQYDYKKLGLKCGLEIHQQLDTEKKLFCRCATELQGSRNPDFTIKRLMRPVLGEMGTFDKGMLTEYEKGITTVYEGYNDIICTYELDDTPPFLCNEEARKIALQIAALLNANIIEEMHVCRKNYLDGSVPSGFQRTMILGTDGYVTLETGKKIGINILSLEEDAARKIYTENKINYFRLDRLGIPMVEITTDPDITDPNECRDCAERLGLLLWSTKVKKVLGSIRQDINISIKKGTRIEIKGVQKLDWIPKLINNEISRQINLIEIEEELNKRGLNEEDINSDPKDLSKILKNTKSNLFAKGLNAGKKLYGVNFKGFKDILGKELIENYRFGTEISSKVKSITGLKGIIHSDEGLRKYNLDDNEINKLRNELNSKSQDCFVLILGNQKEVEKAIKVIINRVKLAFKGVPPETRKALETGSTEFLRELHGGARLYPDTDSPAIINTVEEIDNIRQNLPKYPWDIIEEYSKKYKTEQRMIKDLIFNEKLELFERLINIYPKNPSIILSTLLETTLALKRDGKEIENILDSDLEEIFKRLRDNKISKEAIEDIMILKSQSPELTINDIIDDLGIKSVSIQNLKAIIKNIVVQNEKIIKERQLKAMGPLMGDVMKKVRGKVDGATVSEELKKAIKRKLEEGKNAK
ncbi:MAG: Glu-tRNA(Gln) amidotransferase subunit GatE [Candidatus Thorarchaeota archaeon]